MRLLRRVINTKKAVIELTLGLNFVPNSIHLVGNS